MAAHRLTAEQVALRVVGGSVFAAAGIALALASPKLFHVFLGIVFACIGVAMVLRPWWKGLSSALLGMAFLMFAGLFNYVAFWPGQRNFLVSANGGAFQPTSELGGRIAFGIGALMLDAIIILIVAAWAISIRRQD